MKKRNILALVLIAILALSLVICSGCGKTETPPSTPTAPVGENEKPTESTKDGAGDTAEDTELTCTIYVSCAVLLDNMDMLDKDKHEMVPADGVILPVTTVTFEEGDDVFTLLQRVCRENKIHLEFSEDPIYSSAYVEGLNNLYELDGGELSGWY